jgi:hypothetical protein
MCYVENGQEISLEDAVDGWMLANNLKLFGGFFGDFANN